MSDSRNKGALLLEAWRREQGLTQFRAAVALDMDPSPYNKFELGKKRPGRTTALRFLETAGIPVESWDQKPARENEQRLRRARATAA